MEKVHFYGVLLFSLFFSLSSYVQGIENDLVDLCCFIGNNHFEKPKCQITTAHLTQLLVQSRLTRSPHDIEICRSVGALCCVRNRKQRGCLKGQKRALTIGSCLNQNHYNLGQRKYNNKKINKYNKNNNKNITKTSSYKHVSKRSSDGGGGDGGGGGGGVGGDGGGSGGVGEGTNQDEQECCNCCLLGILQKQEDPSHCFFPIQLSDSNSCMETFVACCSKPPSKVLNAIQVTLLNQHTSPTFYHSTHTDPLSSPYDSTPFVNSFTPGLHQTHSAFDHKKVGDEKDDEKDEDSYIHYDKTISEVIGMTSRTGVSTNQRDLYPPSPTHSTFLDPAFTATITLLGSTKPSDCLTGYAFNKMSKKCEDIDECAVDLHQCSQQSLCYNTLGSHVCKSDEEEDYEDDDDEVDDDDEEKQEDENERKDGKVENGKVEDGKEQKNRKKEVNKDESSGEKVEESLEGSGEKGLEVVESSGEKQIVNTNFKYEITGNEDYWEDKKGDIVTVGIDVFYGRQGAVTVKPTSITSSLKAAYTNHKTSSDSIHIINTPPTKPLDYIHNQTHARVSRYKARTNSPRYMPSLTTQPTNKVFYNRHGQERRCSQGYFFESSTNACREIDECLYQPAVCQFNQTCINTVGSYRCVLKRLSCERGHQPDPFNVRCIDTNECSHSHTNLCGHFSRLESRSYQCHNLPGTYKCVEGSCPRGYALEHDKEQRKRQKLSQWGGHKDIEKYICYPIECGEGYYFNPEEYDCIDIDECEVWKDQVCQRGKICTNTQGSYSCDFAIRCPRGFENHPITGECLDVDECGLRGNELCDKSNSDCINSPGSYHCRCMDGFQHDRHQQNSCLDINECEQRWACQHQCHNTWGSYTCSCRPGFQINTDNRTCDDVDECALKRSLCHGFCINSAGSYLCYCPEGYTKSRNGMFCEDIDECTKNPTICGTSPNTVCTNTLGSHKCMLVSCPNKFRRVYTQHYTTDKHVKCQRLEGHCRMSDVECLKSPLSYSVHFIALHHKLIYIPLNIFTMGGPKNMNNKLRFRLNVTSSFEGHTGRVNTISNRFFYLKQKMSEGIVQLIKPIDEPTDIDMLLSMDLYDRHNRFRGTGEARIILYISKHPWEITDSRNTYHQMYNRQQSNVNQDGTYNQQNQTKFNHHRRDLRQYSQYKKGIETDLEGQTVNVKEDGGEQENTDVKERYNTKKRFQTPQHTKSKYHKKQHKHPHHKLHKHLHNKSQIQSQKQAHKHHHHLRHQRRYRMKLRRINVKETTNMI